MPKKTIQQLKSGKEFVDYAKKQDGVNVRQGKGSHQVIEYKGEQFAVPVHGNEDLSKGLRHSLIKWLIRVGLGLLAVGLFIRFIL
jgi:mRNA interferase HicA